MLKQRIITALVLLALLVGTLCVAPDWPFAAFGLVLIAAAAWEWGRLNTAKAFSPALAVVLAAAGVAAFALGWDRAAPAALWWSASVLWTLGGAWVLRAGVSAWSSHPAPLRWLLGVGLLALAWLAIVNARAVGVNYLLSICCVVWMADIAAYFGGRAWGRRKLAPAISPGKSWEGVWSGMIGVLVLAGVWLAIDRSFQFDSPSLFTHLRTRLGVPGMVLVVLFLVALSVVGDLFESLVKRSAGVKESSNLLPGHGGVLDRFDALLPVLPVALAFASL
ncbi:MAG: phosphatidate cytidylyltransferase [Burkholderiales bacterium]|jgi:phosphatidate cytidylyltransferase|nr:phosphatidate cytidylyltransferase [Burkholderiales bacterium]